MEHKKIDQHTYRPIFVNPYLREKGFSLLEIIIYIAILSLVLLLVSSYIFYFIRSNSQIKGNREVLENARRVLEYMTYEINGSKSVYTPTTTANQLSLQTARYLPAGEDTTYIDFFICNLRICIKKEGQNPIFLTSETTQVENFVVTQVFTNGFPSLKIDITLKYKDTINNVQPSASLTTTTSLRVY